MKAFFTTFFVFSCLSQMTVAAPTADQMIKRADDIRNPGESFVMKVEIKDKDSSSKFDVYLKGKDKTLIVVQEPARDRGRNMLMLDRDFHSYVPNLKRSVRLSLSQKLSGQVSNGDIARTRWHGDYSAKIVETNNNETKLFLKAQKENLTYDQMHLWVKTKTAEPIRADYLALDGKTILKKAYFEGYKTLVGKNRPSIIRIEDLEGNKSVMNLLSMKKQSFEDSFFTIRNMETFK